MGRPTQESTRSPPRTGAEAAGQTFDGSRAPTDAAANSLPPRGKPKLLARVRLALRARHCSRRTVKSYVGWIKRFIFFHSESIVQKAVKRSLVIGSDSRTSQWSGRRVLGA